MDITNRKVIEKQQELAVALLSILNQSREKTDTIRDILLLIKEFTGFEAIAIRLKEGEDFPYYVTSGFPASFVEAERYLCAYNQAGEVIRDSVGNPVLECMCGNVICGRTNPSLPFFTQAGSFWTNSTTKLLASTTEEDRQAHTRNRCHDEGYESVALIPLKSEDKTIGLLQLNDGRKNMFTQVMIKFFEGIGASIGIALERRRVEEALWQERDALLDSEEKYKILAEHSADVIYKINIENEQFTYVSPSVKKILGHTSKESLSLRVQDIMTAASYVKQREELKKALAAGRRDPVILEIEAVHKDGHTLPIEIHSNFILDEQRNPVEILGVARDITKRKNAEKMLKESESRYRSVFENAGTATVIMEKDRVISMVNPEFEKISGYSKEEVEGKMRWTEFVVPEDFERMKKYHRERREKGEKAPSEYEFRFIDREGNIKYIYNKVQMIPETKRSVASLTDMTMRKRTEKALQESEEKFRNLAEHSPNMIFINKKGKVVYANSKCEKIMGYRKDEFYSPDFDFMSLIAPDSIERVKSAFSNHMNGKDVPPFEYALLTKDGKRIDVLVSTGLIQYEGDMSILGVISDITERKLAEETLRESEKRFRTIFEETAVGILIVNAKTRRYTKINPIFQKMSGYRFEELFQMSPYELTHIEDWPSEEKLLNELRSGKRNQYGLQKRYKRKDGKYFWGNVTVTLVRDVSGHPDYTVSIVEDITDRKVAEEALQESTATLKSIFRAAPTGIGMVADRMIKQVNKRLCEITGYAREELLDKSARILYPSQEEFEFVGQEKYNQIHERGTGTVETRWKRKDGTVIDVLLSSTPLDHSDPSKGITFTALDITEQNRVEEERARLYSELKLLNLELEAKVKNRTRALKVAVLEAKEANHAKSNFLASMSHELRTPLNAVIGFSEMLRDQYFGKLNEKQAEYVNDILESGKLLLSLINDILDLSKVEAGKMELELSQVNIKDILDSSLVIIKEKAHRHGIGLDLKISEEMSALKIQADERKLKQVMFNLLSNATKFTPDGGKIQVTAKSTISNEQSAIQICVTDTGIGIATEDQQKIFEEFYQTKSSSKLKIPGTGLGLSLTKQFVKLHGGDIWVESEGKGKGSRFSFVLPT